ncbi:phospholipase A2 inhibitor and Ly6/PLAUR domain-containing protein-like [Bombina bombina]|uniref:phospholipase A2 inhibitor and Ly6/PLAUR domain-containing protein-like n=1 Tax=Bombina bombina TaxID=8345 RepID=UPI00235ACFF3|nr:phospholipase A2 inhibitor and Ly6/PLAUR domain-containing protein-like [Bombina bombina]
MNYIIFVFCILSTLLDTGNCIQCAHCLSSSGHDCDGPLKTCPSGLICASRFAKETVLGTLKLEVVRNCQPISFCDQSFSLIREDHRTIVSSSCCNTDDCTPVKPSTDTVGNGIKCPVCFSPGTTYCSSENLIECTGKENKCYNYILNGESTKISARGCSTDRLCQALVGTIVNDELQAGVGRCVTNPSARTFLI